MKIPARTNSKGNEVPEFQVDECFADDVLEHSWHSHNAGYLKARMSNPRREVLLHEFVWEIAGRPAAECIDHINRDKTDNRLENLRSSTRRLNSLNRGPNVNKGSDFPMGVSRNGKGYRAVIKHRSKRHHLGTFKTVEEASASYQEAREILIEFAALPGYEDVLNG